MEDKFDALGRKLVIGCRYAYATSSSGFVTSFSGTLIKINKSRVTLELDGLRTGLTESVEEQEFKPGEKRAVAAAMLIPLAIR